MARLEGTAHWVGSGISRGSEVVLQCLGSSGLGVGWGGVRVPGCKALVSQEERLRLDYA